MADVSLSTLAATVSAGGTFAFVTLAVFELLRQLPCFARVYDYRAYLARVTRGGAASDSSSGGGDGNGRGGGSSVGSGSGGEATTLPPAVDGAPRELFGWVSYRWWVADPPTGTVAGDDALRFCRLQVGLFVGLAAFTCPLLLPAYAAVAVGSGGGGAAGSTPATDVDAAATTAAGGWRQSLDSAVAGLGALTLPAGTPGSPPPPPYLFWAVLAVDVAVAVATAAAAAAGGRRWLSARRIALADTGRPENYAVLVEGVPVRDAAAVGAFWERLFPGAVAGVILAIRGGRRGGGVGTAKRRALSAAAAAIAGAAGGEKSRQGGAIAAAVAMDKWEAVRAAQAAVWGTAVWVAHGVVPPTPPPPTASLPLPLEVEEEVDPGGSDGHLDWAVATTRGAVVDAVGFVAGGAAAVAGRPTESTPLLPLGGAPAVDAALHEGEPTRDAVVSPDSPALPPSAHTASADGGLAPPTLASSAIVVFTSIRTARVAAQVTSSPDGVCMVPSPAPPPDTLRWGDVGIPRSHSAPLHAASVSAIVTLTVSYVAPVTALAGLANFGSVAALIGYQPLIEFAARPAVAIVQGALSPLLLSLLMGMVPAAVRAIVGLRRLACASELDAAALSAHVAFEATTTVGVVLAAGALIPAAAALVSSPPAALAVFATAASTQGLFYVNYVLTQIAWALPLVLIDPIRLLWSAAVRAAIAAEEAEDLATAAAAAAPHMYEVYATVVMSLVGLVYATVSPLVVAATAVYHLAAWNVWRYELLYARAARAKGPAAGLPSSAAGVPSDGADGADGALSRLFVGGLDALGWAAAVRHALMVGMYLLRSFWPGVVSSVVLLCGGVAARRVVISRYGPVVRHGCLSDLSPPKAAGVVEEGGGGCGGEEPDLDVVARALAAYVPPPLRPLPPLPAAVSGSRGAPVPLLTAAATATAATAAAAAAAVALRYGRCACGTVLLLLWLAGWCSRLRLPPPATASARQACVMAPRVCGGAPAGIPRRTSVVAAWCSSSCRQRRRWQEGGGTPATTGAPLRRRAVVEARLRPGRPGRAGAVGRGADAGAEDRIGGGGGGGGDRGSGDGVLGFIDPAEYGDAELAVSSTTSGGAGAATDLGAANGVSPRVEVGANAHEVDENWEVEAFADDDHDVDAVAVDAVDAATAAAEAWAINVDDYPPAGYTDSLASAAPPPVTDRDTETNNTPPAAPGAPPAAHYGSRLRTSSRGIEACVLVGVDILRRSGLAARYEGGSGSNSRLGIEASLAELGRLAETAGMAVVGSTYQRLQAPLTGSYIGTGKVAEVRSLLQSAGACTAVFDDELTPAQQRTLEAAFGGEAGGIKVLDRTALILDIFAQHAGSREGALQTELALYQYRLPRLTRMWTHLERQSGAGGVGLRGPGETQLEVDRRLIGERVARLRRSIERLRAHRERAREKRRKGGLMVVALVGYTNAGKSSLMEGLTAAVGGVADQLFATLDPTTRKARLLGVEGGEMSDGGTAASATAAAAAAVTNGDAVDRGTGHSGVEVLITDTVGFIQKLPTQLAAAFTATLEEVTAADVIVHVVDGSLEGEVRGVQIAAVNKILAELGAADKPTVVVLNKMDLLAGTADEAKDDEMLALASASADDDALRAVAAGREDPVAALVAEVTAEVAASMPGLVPDHAVDGGTQAEPSSASASPPPVVAISALTGTGLDDLSTTIADVLRSVLRPVAARIPYTHGELVAAVHDRGTVEVTEYGPDGTYVEGRVPADLYARLERFLVLPPGEEASPVEAEEDWVAIAKKRA
ncbi:hypothetical protein MMPV_008460 [Pyropia vietnamensis]